MGDALGDDCEFQEYDLGNYKKILSPEGPWPPGEITDDSEMALSLTYAIMDLPDISTLDTKYLFFYHGIWIETAPIAAGAATKNSLRLFNYKDHTKLLYNDTKDKEEENDKIMGEIVETIKKINIKTLANGHLMRCSAFHVWYYYLHKKDIEELLKSNEKKKFLKLYQDMKAELVKDSCLTHPNEEMPIIASIFSFMVQCSLFGYSAKSILTKLNNLLSNEIFDVEESLENKVKKLINDTLDDFMKKDFDKNTYFNDMYRFMGFYVHAIRLSLYFLYDFDNIQPMKGYTKYRTIMNHINNFGGDTDTNSAIVGQVIGPLIGFDNFGEKELRLILNFVSPSRFQYSASMVYFFIHYLEKMTKKKLEENVNKIPRFNFIRYLLKMIYSENILQEI
jgi:ADP-ribosylglycohydrolase